jgi:TolB-like protein
MAANHDTLVGKRLDSWKEIASFLGRAERTVKRWETERGLPVHRIPGGGRSAVFAYSNELADWLKGRTEDLDEDSSADVENQTPAAPQVSVIAPPAVPAVKNWPLPRIAAWIIPLLFAAALITYLSADHTGSPVKVIASRQPSSPEANNLSIGPDSVAVLPFTNVRGNAGTDYLSDGITESLIGSLARIPQLKVRSRDSVFRYKGKDVEVRTAGADLGVSAVVSGRVTLQGDAIEISAELTDVLDNTEIWGHRYTGKASNLISLQQQIAGDIAGELRSKLSRSERQQVISQGTQDAEAYNLYLKGRYAWNQRNFSNLDASIPYFNQAIAKDPQYALAYSALADVWAALPYFGDNPSEVFPKSSTAARKALQLDPTLAHPHAVLGSNEMAYDWDFAGGEAEFKKAIELDPNDATAHQWYAENLGMLGGREQDALHEIDLAHLLDPTSLIILRVKGSVLVAARRYDDSIVVCKQLLDENPTFNLARDCLAYAYWGKGMYSQAVEIWKAYGQNTGNKDDAEFGDALDRGFRAAGWPGALTQAIKVRLSEYKAGGFASPYQIARLYADLGDKEKAFQWLDTAYREHDFLLDQLNTAFQVDKIRSDPRFAALVHKVGLPQ